MSWPDHLCNKIKHMFQMESYLIRNSGIEYKSKRHKETQGSFTFVHTSKARHEVLDTSKAR